MINVTKKGMLAYVLTPQLRPRFRDLFASGFHHIPYFIALVYQIVRLLPANHPYVNAQNIGRFGIRNVIAEAANHLVVSRKNIDQIIVFSLILIGMVLFLIQFVLLGMAIFVQPVMAQSFSDMFIVDEPAQDLAFIMMDMVFGVPDLFNSCVTTSNCVDTHGQLVARADGSWLLSGMTWPFPIHVATHQLFALYSMGLLVVAVMIACYFIATVVLETAQTGTPFGKRFNKVWAPIRIVVAIGLLVPLQNGLNSAQYIVLYAAKYGSGFATNGWTRFNEELGFDVEAGRTYLGNSQLIAEPNVPDVSALLQMLYVAKICREVEYGRQYRATRDGASGAGAGENTIEPYLVKNSLSGANNGSLRLTGEYGSAGGFTPYEDLIAFADGASQVQIRFGPPPDPTNYNKEMGYVGPVCGEINFPLSDARVPGSANPPNRGAEIMQRAYWWIIHAHWFYINDGTMPEPEIIDLGDGSEPFEWYSEPPEINQDFNYPLNTAIAHAPWWEGITAADLFMPITEIAVIRAQYTKDWIRTALTGEGGGLIDDMPGLGDGAIEEQLRDPRWDMTDTLRAKGWGGAAIWYNKIAEINGSLSDAVYDMPTVKRYPAVMEYVLEVKRGNNQSIIDSERFKPELVNGDAITFTPSYEADYAEVMNIGFKLWEDAGHGASARTTPTGNNFIDTINQFLGTDGLFSMRENDQVHPLAQLVSVGRALVQRAITSLGSAAAAALVGHGAQDLAGVASIGVGVFMTITTIGLTIGFILFYVIPFLPFIYFFFALGGWVKGIFEAMVGAPLWALAHIRIDGNGLPGQAAVNGYFLIFEIFLRPILIVFGLLASISIFSALVAVMNDVWDLVTNNLAGFDVDSDTDVIDFMRSPVDEFFFTLVYAIVVYMMGMSSFKLIDLIPNNILRWMGQSVSTFNDQREDAAQSMMGTASVGGQQAIQSVGGGVEGMLKPSPGKGGG